jgi:hypothetical protein
VELLLSMFRFDRGLIGPGQSACLQENTYQKRLMVVMYNAL